MKAIIQRNTKSLDDEAIGSCPRSYMMNTRFCFHAVILELTALLALVPFSHVLAQERGDVEIRVNGGANVFYVGERNVVEFWIRNDASLSGMSLAFEFSVARDYQWVTPYGSKPSETPYVQEEGDAVDGFSFGGLQVSTRFDNAVSDSILLGGASSAPDYPAHSQYTLCYTVAMDILPDQRPLKSGVCIDNVFMPPAGDWLFVDGIGAYVPLFQGSASQGARNPNAAAVYFDICVGSDCGRCCLGRVGDANQSGDDEPTIGDVSTMIDAKFIANTCDGILLCLLEADINQSGGASPTCDDITIGDISTLIDYLFITGSSLGLSECL